MRKRETVLLAVIWWMCLAVSTALAQQNPSTTWDELNEAETKAFKAGHYSEAETMGLKALKQAEAFGPRDQRLGFSMNNLAMALEVESRFAEAEDYFKRAIQVNELALGPEDPEIAVNLNNLAKLYRTTGRLTLAEPCAQRALRINEKSYGSRSTPVARNLETLGAVEQDEGKYAEAESLFRRALFVLEENQQAEDTQWAATASSLARLYAVLGRFKEAEPLYLRSVAILEKSWAPPIPTMAGRFMVLRSATRRKGNTRRAKPCIDAPSRFGNRG